jgi:hypothetical protein
MAHALVLISLVMACAWIIFYHTIAMEDVNPESKYARETVLRNHWLTVMAIVSTENQTIETFAMALATPWTFLVILDAQIPWFWDAMAIVNHIMGLKPGCVQVTVSQLKSLAMASAHGNGVTVVGFAFKIQRFTNALTNA